MSEIVGLTEHANTLDARTDGAGQGLCDSELCSLLYATWRYDTHILALDRELFL